MQTFLPYENFSESLRCLDYRRLGKQRVEAMQILNALQPGYTQKGWVNHPATKMWRGYEEALKMYMNMCIEEWVNRGYNNNMEIVKIAKDVTMPPWLGNEDFHASHRSNLLRKDLEYYSQFNWSEPDDLPYIWPV